MSGASNIEWTDATWNPIVGCSVLSPGCTHCYAMRDAWRKHHNPATPHYRDLTKRVNGNTVWTGKLALAPEHILTVPLRWKKPRRIFVNSMGDLFHENAPDEWIDKVFAVMALCPQHQFQVLTKRAERMRDYLARLWAGDNADENHPRYAAQFRCWMAMPKIDESKNGCKPPRFPLPNAWLGVSAERQQEADERIPHLLQTPAAIRFVSCEPLLGRISLEKWIDRCPKSERVDGPLHTWRFDGDDPYVVCHWCGERRSTTAGIVYGPRFTEKPGLDWIIVGGESGPGARPMHPDWARSLRDQCEAAGVPFFFKQTGEWLHRDCVNVSREHGAFNPDGSFERGIGWSAARDMLQTHVVMERVGKKAAGRLLDGKEHNGFPG